MGAAGHATPGAAAPLVDQGTNVVVNDPADTRLFAAKYFLTLAGESGRTVLAAFSSDDPASSQFSLLPHKPVTVFPLENPQFTADGRSYFATVDQLGALEGGASPLFAAIDRTLDFAAADPQPDAKSLVVVTTCIVIPFVVQVPYASGSDQGLSMGAMRKVEPHRFHVDESGAVWRVIHVGKCLAP